MKFLVLVSRWFVRLLISCNCLHWWLLATPSTLRCKTIVIVGTGSIGKNLLASMLFFKKTVILIDDKAARYPYSILGITVSSWGELGQLLDTANAPALVVLTMIKGQQQASERLDEIINERAIIRTLPVEIKHYDSYFVTPTKRFLNLAKLEHVNSKSTLSVEELSASNLYVEHNLGGGSFQFSKQFLEKHYKAPLAKTLILTFCDEQYHLSDWRKRYVILSTTSLSSVFSLLSKINLNTVYVSNLYGFESPDGVISHLIKVKKQSMISFVHDYYSVCQSYTLWNQNDQYCGIPNSSVCESCITQNRHVKDKSISIEQWRYFWSELYLASAEVVVFSEDSKRKLQQVYSDLKTIIVRPHDTQYFQPVYTKRRVAHQQRAAIRVGVIGPLTLKKGEGVIKHIQQYLANKKSDWQLIIIGMASNAIASLSNVLVTGAYEIEHLDELVKKMDLDVFLYPSLCPETFSYTVSELILMEYPIVGFDLGAQADKVSSYKLGTVIPLDSTPESIVDALQNSANQIEVLNE